VTEPAAPPSTTDVTRVSASEGQRASTVALYPQVMLHAPIDVPQFFVSSIVAAGFPMLAGVALYGWRAFVVLLVVVISTLTGIALWRRVGGRAAHLNVPHALWLSIILALALPPHLWSAKPGPLAANALWPLVPFAGLMLAMVLWLFGGIGARVHPVVVVFLLLVFAAHDSLVPHYVLTRDHLVTGDVLNVDLASTDMASNEPWATAANQASRGDAIYRVPAWVRLTAFTRGQPDPERAGTSLDSLIRDRMPPLEDLIIGGQPNAIGSASAIAVIMGGLFLLYRGLTDFRLPLLAILSAYATLITLPIPLTVTQEGVATLHWLAMRTPGIGWSLGFTFVNYELMAGPLLFVAFFLATAPGVRPMSRRAQAVYAIFFGVCAAALQLYLSVAYGPYLALLLAGLTTPLLDRFLRPRPLV
jgi:Na+-translocating ferredoxin:NAD+ oxidoreductase RnfD subunit